MDNNVHSILFGFLERGILTYRKTKKRSAQRTILNSSLSGRATGDKNKFYRAGTCVDKKHRQGINIKIVVQGMHEFQTTVGFVDPKSVTDQLPIEPGQRVADFGCGAGYFSCAFAEAVGMNGQVIALDILPASLEAVTSRAKSLNLTNVTTKRVNLEREGGSGLDPNSLDWVVIKDMLFQNEDKETILYEAARVLKIQGKVFVMEWVPDHTMVGPAKNLRITREQLRGLLESAGLSVIDELSVGEYHFAYLVEKKAW